MTSAVITIYNVVTTIYASKSKGNCEIIKPYFTTGTYVGS